MIQEVLYELNVEEFEKFNDVEGNVVHASVLPLCPLKWFYRLKYPDLVKAQQYSGYLILGKLVHIGLQRLLRELYDSGRLSGFKVLGVEVDLEKSINIENGDFPVIVKIKGRADLIVEKDGSKYVVEIKTSKSDFNIPAEHHVLQLKIYMNLASVEKGLLLYITPDRITEYYVNEAISDFELQNLVQEFFKKKGPRYGWECNYCPFNILCPNKKANSKR